MPPPLPLPPLGEEYRPLKAHLNIYLPSLRDYLPAQVFPGRGGRGIGGQGIGSNRVGEGKGREKSASKSAGEAKTTTREI